jgi:hypothetical protein
MLTYVPLSQLLRNTHTKPETDNLRLCLNQRTFAFSLPRVRGNSSNIMDCIFVKDLKKQEIYLHESTIAKGQ